MGDHRQLFAILLLVAAFHLLFLHSRIATAESDVRIEDGAGADRGNASREHEEDDRSTTTPSPPPQSPPPPPSSSPPPPSTTDSKDDSTAGAGSSGDRGQEKHDPAPEKDEPPPSTEEIGHPPPEGEEEDPSHCCGVKIHACLSSPGDSTDGMLSLVIKSRDVVTVKVTTPSFLSADPSELTTTADGKGIQVKIEMADAEAAKQQPSSKISVTSDVESCDLPVPVPSYNLGYGDGDGDKPLLVGLRSPVAGLGMMAVAAVLVMGLWACLRCRGWPSKRHPAAEEPRYVELEMGMPEGQDSTNAAEDDEWDKVWDGDWEEEKGESEPVGNPSFTRSDSLSAKGLASRRSAKEGRAD